jgi:chromosome segregation ATPase
VRIAAAADAPPLLVETARRLVAKNDLDAVEAEARQAGAVKADQQKLADLRARWNQSVKPHREALREAAQTQYDVIAELRREQQRLIDEADRIQRVIDELEREYQEMTTPRPATERANQP